VHASAAGAAAPDNTLIYVLGGLLVVAIVVIVALVVKNQGGGGPAPVAQTRTRAVEDEGTQVRIAGHRLIRMHGGVKVGAEIPVGNLLTIGRDKSMGLSLSDSEMSSHHAEVGVSSGSAYVLDKGSTNGTFVNDERVEPDIPRTLKDGDVIKLGSTTLLYKSGA
jgi:pSer/pThr/pTyr-binding forkhead associated (FHA) protein